MHLFSEPKYIFFLNTMSYLLERGGKFRRGQARGRQEETGLFYARTSPGKSYRILQTNGPGWRVSAISWFLILRAEVSSVEQIYLRLGLYNTLAITSAPFGYFKSLFILLCFLPQFPNEVGNLKASIHREKCVKNCNFLWK